MTVSPPHTCIKALTLFIILTELKGTFIITNTKSWEVLGVSFGYRKCERQ